MPESPNQSAKRHAPATLRNREPIAAILRDALPERGTVLEIASGSGEHAVHFAAAFPGIVWQPSDAAPDCLASIRAWSTEATLPNLLPPLALDVRTLPWPNIAPASFDAVVSINMIHIAPFECCRSLMVGARTALKPGGLLLLYGPFKLEGRHTAPSNQAFDESLRAMDPRFGVRDLADVAAEAAACGLALEKQVAMPANNLSVLFRKAMAE
jgi:cyclopropane fatty-acyl-phospholipid synthase-like methyltransferase